MIIHNLEIQGYMNYLDKKYVSFYLWPIKLLLEFRTANCLLFLVSNN